MNEETLLQLANYQNLQSPLFPVFSLFDHRHNLVDVVSVTIARESVWLLWSTADSLLCILRFSLSSDGDGSFVESENGKLYLDTPVGISEDILLLRPSPFEPFELKD